MTRNPKYASTNEPVLIGDIVSYKGNVYEITSIGTTSIGIIVSGYSADNGQTFSTEDYTSIAKVSKERAEAYRDPKNSEMWKKAFEIAEDTHATICRIMLTKPNAYDATPTYLFGLVPEDVEVKLIAPWAVCLMHPTVAMSVDIMAIDRNYPAPRRMLEFAKNLIAAYESDQLTDFSHRLWLVPRNNKTAYWYATKLDDACRRLEDTYYEHDLAPQDIVAHITDMCDMFQEARPNMLDNSPQKRSLEWWREYAAALTRA